MKSSVALDSIDAAALADYAAITGHLLAKGHARTSGASMIVGYAGSSDRLDIALARFARLYADQTEADHAASSRPLTRASCLLSVVYESASIVRAVSAGSADRISS